jgi:hypothetical protein
MSLVLASVTIVSVSVSGIVDSFIPFAGTNPVQALQRRELAERRCGRAVL